VSARILAAALIAGWACACGAPQPASPRVVVQRWADLPGVGGDERPEPHPLRLGTATRDAFAVAPVSQLTVELDQPAQVLVFSTAARSAAPTAGRVRFGVQARVSGEWQTIFSEAVAAQAGAWRDHRLDLAAAAPGARAFRFDTRAEPGPDAVRGAEAWWGSVTWLGRAAERRPNVILISLDTLGAAQLSAFGNAPGVSPHIDAFLDGGFSFRRAFAQYGNTLVSHASLFTGLYPVHHRYYPGGPLVPVDSLVAELARSGWFTAAFTEGAFVSAAYGFGHGFDWYDDGALGLSRQIAGGAPHTFARVEEWLEHYRDTRFLLFVHTYEVHTPYAPRDEASWQIVERITPGDARAFTPEFQARRSFAHNSRRRLLSDRDLAHLRALQSGEVHGLDEVLAGFFARLAELGLERDTLVVLTADHGDQFGEHGKVGHGETLHNAVLHVPLGFRWPGHVVPGASDDPVQLVDVMPTVLELAGLPVPAGRDGRSLAGLLLAGGTAPEPRPAYAEQITARGECLRLGLPKECRLDRYSVQTDRFKLVSSRVPEAKRLFDLRADPLEDHDVAAEHPDEVRHLSALLDAYLAGAEPVPPPGAPVAPDEATRQRLEALGYLE
jgi:arylsulfatase A-like enzyme